MKRPTATEKRLVAAARRASDVRELAVLAEVAESSVYRLRHSSEKVAQAVDRMRLRTGRAPLRSPDFWVDVEATLEKAARTASSIRELAAAVGLGESTLYRWRHQRPKVARLMASVLARKRAGRRAHRR